MFSKLFMIMISGEWSTVTNKEIANLIAMLPEYPKNEVYGFLMPIENQNRIAWMFRNSLYKYRKGKTGKLIIRKSKFFEYDFEQYQKFKT